MKLCLHFLRRLRLESALYMVASFVVFEADFAKWFWNWTRCLAFFVHCASIVPCKIVLKFDLSCIFRKLRFDSVLHCEVCLVIFEAQFTKLSWTFLSWVFSKRNLRNCLGIFFVLSFFEAQFTKLSWNRTCLAFFRSAIYEVVLESDSVIQNNEIPW